MGESFINYTLFKSSDDNIPDTRADPNLPPSDSQMKMSVSQTRIFQILPTSIALKVQQGADQYIFTAIALLLLWAIFQLNPFSRPPPVKKKKLPRRPALSILFKPDDTTITSNDDLPSVESTSHLAGSFASRAASSFLRSSFSVSSDHLDDAVLDVVKEVALNDDTHSTPPTSPKRSRATSSENGDTETTTNATSSAPHPSEKTSKRNFDLPDSFAPLLSSSQTEMLLHHLTADLIHGVHAEARVKMQEGKHEIPLDKNPDRPQFVLNVPKGSCRLSAMATIGSDCFTSAQDLDVTIPTSSRSRPMVKNAELTFDPALPLLNVAPTLIHFPTLFEDKSSVIPRLRRIQFFRLFVDSIVAISSSIEKLLWVLESFLQIHLGKIKVTPLYKGTGDDDSPEWRMSLAFSGHVMLFGLIPIPFINVILPTFIIPQPHALLEYLLSKQPLASAKIRRENIAEQRIGMALLETMDTWNGQLQLVATPPAVGIDLTLPGGVSLGLELMHGRDPQAGRSRDMGESSFANSKDEDMKPASHIYPPTSGASMSSWTTNDETRSEFRSRSANQGGPSPQLFDANLLVPWKCEVSAKGKMGKNKMTFHLLNCSFRHEDTRSLFPTKSQFQTRGSFAVWKYKNEMKTDSKTGAVARRASSFAHRAALAGATETPSVASLLLFPDEMEYLHTDTRMLEYDYAFDISDDSRLDAITFSVGANHPMLNGGSMVTTILESLYAHGSISAREKAVLDPLERRQKRNVLRHLPAIDFTFGMQNSFIPPESHSYTNDGQTKTIPSMSGGRIMVRMLGGIKQEEQEQDEAYLDIGMPLEDSQSAEHGAPVADGIKVVANIGVSSIVLNSETSVKEFPELDIFEGTKLRNISSGKLGGSIHCHLRPQQVATSMTTAGPNIFNPLEAYEIDFSGSTLHVRVKESTTSLGHRRIIIPTETTIKVKVVESVIDMALEGKTECELSWDFQGLSPILQVTEVGLFPESVIHEKKEQVSLLIGPLRQGRLNLQISPVGGIHITKAETSREDKEGLYDWKFFNALVSASPDQSATERLLDVIHDKRTMGKLVQVIKLLNYDCYRFLDYGLTQVWRVKDIMDQEGISDPKHIVPGHRCVLDFCDFLDIT
jgi:hypothetical protein